MSVRGYRKVGMLLALVLGSALSLPLCAGLQWDQKKIELVASWNQDFLEAGFVYENTGKDPVVIEEVLSGCKCTVPKWGQKKVLPGERGEVLVRYRVGKGTGTRRSQLSVKTSEGTDVLRLMVRIPARVIMKPRFVLWKRDSVPEEREVEVRIKKIPELELTALEYDESQWRVSLELVEAGKLYRIRVKPRTTSAPLRSAILVHTNREKSLTLYAYVVE